MKKIIIKATSRFNKKDFIYPFLRQQRKIIDLSPKKLEFIINDVIKRSFERIELLGGALLMPDFEKIFNVLAKADPGLLSLYLTPQTALSGHVKKIKEAGRRADCPIRVIFYLAGLDAKTNDHVFGPGAMKKFKGNLSIAVKNKLAVKVIFLLTQASWQKLPQIIEFSRKNSLPIAFQELMPLGDAQKRKNLILEPDQISQFWQALKNWKEFNHLPLISGFSNFFPNQQSCSYAGDFFLDEKARLKKCWLDDYFKNDKKISNNTKSACCASCFNWKPAPALCEEPNKRSAKNKLAKDVSQAFWDITKKNKAAAPAPSQSGLACDKLSSEALRPENLNLIGDLFQRIKRLGNLKIDWLKNYHYYQPQTFIFFKNYLNRFASPSGTVKTNQKISRRISLVLQHLNFLGRKQVSIFGADSLPRPVLKKLSSLLSGNNFSAALNLDRTCLKTTRELLGQAGFSRLHFNLFGHDSKSHDSVVGPAGAFDKIMESVEFLTEKRNENKISFGFNFFITPLNLKGLEQMTDFSGMMNLSFSAIAANQLFKNTPSRLNCGPKTLKQAKKILMQAAKNHDNIPSNILSFKEIRTFEI